MNAAPVPPIPAIRAGKSLSFRALSAGFGAAEAVMPRDFPAINLEAIERSARVSLDGAAREGLGQLCGALARETDLSLFGRVSVRYDLTRLARNAAMIDQMHARLPAIGAAPVTSPLFIMGLPRSGTSFLHTLLGYDPDVMVPRVWQTLYPAPRPRDFDKRTSKLARKTDRQLDIFAGMAPDFPAIHPIDADSPQECSEITAHVFQSLRFDTTFRVPSYTKWLDDFGHDHAFAFHKKYLQALQHGVGAKFWALKCPDHTFSIPGILSAYPDARFVVVHRDPVHVFASVAHMTEVLRAPFLRRTDAAEIGRQVTDRWIEGARLLVEFDRSQIVPPERLVNIQYEDLTQKPLETVALIYRRFGHVMSADAAAGMQAHLDAAPRGGYGRNRYQLAAFGINPERLRPAFSLYTDYFGVKSRMETRSAAA